MDGVVSVEGGGPWQVAQRDYVVDALVLAFGGGDLVPDAYRGDLPRTGKRSQHVEGQTSHRGGGIEVLGHGQERYTGGVEQFANLGGVGQRSR